MCRHVSVLNLQGTGWLAILILQGAGWSATAIKQEPVDCYSWLVSVSPILRWKLQYRDLSQSSWVLLQSAL